MKYQDWIVLGLAGLAVYFIVKSKGGAAASTPAPTVSAGTSELFDARGLPFVNGWRYFSDGTSIDPQGNYYHGGAQVWGAPA